MRFMAHDVFLSYSSEDKEVAQCLCGVLEAAGIRCWIAPRDVVAGQDYAEAIVDAIDQGAVFVLLLSSSSNESPHVRREAERAASKAKRIVPLRIQDIVPGKSIQYFIGSSHWMDALEPPFEPKFQAAAQAILRHLGKPAGAPVPNPAAPAAVPALAPQAPAPQALPSAARSGPSAAGWVGAVLVVGLAVALGAYRSRSRLARLSGPAAPAVVAPAQGLVSAPPPSSGSQLTTESPPAVLDGCGGSYAQKIEYARKAMLRGQGYIAANELKSAIEACPGGATAQKLLPEAKRMAYEDAKKKGEEETRWGRAAKAASFFNEALRHWPGSSDDPELVPLRDAILKTGEPLTELGGENPEGCGRDYGRDVGWGLTYLARGNAFSAVSSLESAVQACPTGKSAAQLLGKARLARFQELKKKGEALAREGHDYRAALEYRDAAKSWPGSQSDPEFVALQAEITRLESRR
ncbi:MAG: TIR domain-containing protein [Elusimicrobia bacterium]|nr:TIR domain-containing protein [Elusimicrobiota bacterium]